jgi:hypothetical protein
LKIFGSTIAKAIDRSARIELKGEGGCGESLKHTALSTNLHPAAPHRAAPVDLVEDDVQHPRVCRITEPAPEALELARQLQHVESRGDAQSPHEADGSAGSLVREEGRHALAHLARNSRELKQRLSG